MAHLIANGTGNCSSAATWRRGTNTPTVHASTNITIISSSYYTAVFTAPSITDSALGLALLVSSVSGAGTLTATLQEYDGASWVDKNTGTRTFASMSATAPNQIRLSAPYTFTTTTAGYYRWKLTQSGGTSIIVAADSGGADVAYLSIDSRTQAPATTYDLLMTSPNGSAITLTIDGTITFGNGSGAAIAQSWRSWSFGAYLADSVVLINDPSGNSKLECKGHFITGNGGSRNWDVSDLATHTMNLEIEHSTANADFGDIVIGNPTLYTHDGFEVTNKATHYVSGTGTTATPLMVADSITDWWVNARVEITSTDVYSQLEVKYIKSFSGGGIILCDTPGGAESGLAYSHTTDAWVVFMDSNLTWTAKDTSYGYFFLNDITTQNDATHYVKSVHFHTPGSVTPASANPRSGIQHYYAASRYLLFDNVVITDCVGTASVNYGYYSAGSRHEEDVNNIRVHGGGYTLPSSPNKTYTNFIALGTTNSGILLSNGNGINFYYSIVNGCNTAGTANHGAVYNSNADVNFYTCDMQSNRANIMIVSNSNSRFVSCSLGDISTAEGTNITYIAQYTKNYVVFDSCSFDATKIKFAGYTTDMVEGSRVAFHRFNNTDYKMYTLLAGATAECTGAGLDDTTVHTTGNHCIKLTMNTTGDSGIFYFKTPSFVGYSGNANMFVKKNAAMASDEVRMEVWLPSSTVADASAYTPSNSDFNWISEGKAYSGGMGQYTTIKVIGVSTAVGAAFYVADIYGGTDDMNKLNFWEDGMPSSVMVTQAGNPEAVGKQQTSLFDTAGTIFYDVAKTSDLTTLSSDTADAVWDEATSSHIASGSFGEKVEKKLLTPVKFIGLK